MLVHIVVVNDSTYLANIRKLSMDLHILQDGNAGAWIFLGDFNSILGTCEKVGGRLSIQASRSEFHTWINANSLHPLVNKRVNFIWNKLEDMH